MLDSDMLICKNMDHLLEMDLPADSIAAAHVCACNPWKLKHYPEDW
jgi:lipopolysaccharide biosynthesis glycosyltransferase